MQCGIFLTAIGTLLLLTNGVLLSESPIGRTPGYLDFDNLPETNFTCEGKVIGGYYADIETGCQMFHVCTIGQRGDMTDIKFLCLNGTVFDQETRVCERVDEVDCSRSQDFYDLNLELYHNAGIQPEEPEKKEKKKEEPQESTEEEIYDESYELETEEPPQTTTKIITTTTTTTTTTPKPVYTSPKPVFNIVLPNVGNKNSGTHLTGLVSGYKTAQPPSVPNFNENRNTGTHLTGFVPGIPSQSPRPFGIPQQPAPVSYAPQKTTPSSFGQPQHQSFGYQNYPKPTLDTGLKPPPNNNYQQFTVQPTATSFKPTGYESYKNYYYASSSPSPSMLVEEYGHKTQPTLEPSKRPLVVVSHHFPALPTKTSYEDYSGFSSPAASYHRYKPIRLQHKPNPTILALQSQQKKVHQLHQEGLEHAEHQIQQVASRNAEISSLQSQQDETARSYDTDNSGSRETKEIHSSKSPAIVITSTSSTSSRVQKIPANVLNKNEKITNLVKTVTDEKGQHISQQIYSSTPEFQSELEKLFKNTPKKDESSDMDLEQLLLAWKLKTNQEVTKSDIEKVFLSLDLSKFKNGEAISLAEIFRIMNATEADRTTRVPPTTYDEYTEEDVALDPFYKDVPKVGGTRSKRQSEIHVVPIMDNGRFPSRLGSRKAKGRASEPISIADIEVITGSVMGRKKQDAEITLKSGVREGRTIEERKPRGRGGIKFKPTGELIPQPGSTARPFPKTSFTCRDKIAGGFYADTEVDCQLFHICTDAGDGTLRDQPFYCGESTRFNQRSRTCQAEEVVDCRLSTRYYHLNENFEGGAASKVPVA